MEHVRVRADERMSRRRDRIRSPYRSILVLANGRPCPPKGDFQRAA